MNKALVARLMFVSTLLLGAAWTPQAHAGDAASVKGEIVIAKGLLQNKIDPQAALYLIARPAGQNGGPPLAVKRFTPPFHFPLAFTLSSADAMMSDAAFEGKIQISARLAQAGSATPARKGDFETSAAKIVEVGKPRKVLIVLDRFRGKDAEVDVKHINIGS